MLGSSKPDDVTLSETHSNEQASHNPGRRQHDECALLLPVMGVVRGVAVIMNVIMVMSMLMTVPAVVMVSLLQRPFRTVGAALGLERPSDLMHMRAESFHHLGQDMIRFDVDRMFGDLCRRVPISDMPGDPGERVRVVGVDLHQILGRRLHLDQGSIGELERIAMRKVCRLGQIQQELVTSIALHGNAPSIAGLTIQRDGIDGDSLAQIGAADDSC
jgi:hypothetical protein